MNRTRRSILALAILVSVASHAQEATIENVLRSRSRGSGTIMKNNELAGYWNFYQVDREDSKNNSFRMAMFDNNLASAGEIKITRPKASYLMENVFNGKAFMFLYLNGKEIEMETYDAKGAKLGSATYEDASKWERMRMTQALQMGTNAEVNQSIFPMGDEGFIKQTLVKGDKRGYQLVAYDNQLKEVWVTTASLAGEIENLDVIEVTDKYIIGSVLKQKNLFDMPDNTLLAMFDVKTGKRLWEKEISHQGKPMTVLNAFQVEGKDEILLLGEYFEPKANIIKGKSQGMYSMRLGLDGVPLQTELYNWEKDVLPFVPADEKGKQDMRRIFVHKVVRLPNGTVHLIGEEYNKAVSPTGGIQLTMRDMFIFELDAELKLKRCEVVPKTKSRVAFPTEYAQLSGSVLAQLVKLMGYFDYEFTTVDNNGGRYFCTYTDYDRSKNEDGDKIGTYAGTIVGDGVNKVTLDKYDVKAKGATYFRVYPAKPGYILVSEYRRKLKRISYRLERVNF